MKETIALTLAFVCVVTLVIVAGTFIGVVATYPTGERKSVEICMDEHPDYCQTVTTFTTGFKKVR